MKPEELLFRLEQASSNILVSGGVLAQQTDQAGVSVENGVAAAGGPGEAVRGG